MVGGSCCRVLCCDTPMKRHLGQAGGVLGARRQREVALRSPGGTADCVPRWYGFGCTHCSWLRAHATQETAACLLHDLSADGVALWSGGVSCGRPAWRAAARRECTPHASARAEQLVQHAAVLVRLLARPAVKASASVCGRRAARP